MEFLERFLERIQMPNVIVGLVLAMIGLGAVLLARRITRAVRKTDKIDTSDHVYLWIKGFGLVALCVAMIIMIIK